MAFTLKNARENKAMAERASELIIERRDLSWKKRREDVRIVQEIMQEIMTKEFPDVTPDRVRHQVSAAFIREYSKLVRNRGNSGREL